MLQSYVCVLCNSLCNTDGDGGVGMAGDGNQNLISNVGKLSIFAGHMTSIQHSIQQSVAAEMLSQAILQLAKQVKSVASTLRFGRSREFLYTPSNASSTQDPDFRLQLIKVSNNLLNAP